MEERELLLERLELALDRIRDAVCAYHGIF